MINLNELTNEELLKLRDTTKQKVAEFKNKQMAMKILLNSGYGATSNQFFRWYSDDIAESITLSGQLSVRWIERELNAFLNQILKTNDIDYIVAIDTDSNYINVSPVVKRAFGETKPSQEEVTVFLENFAKKVEDVIEEGYQKLYREMNVLDPCMHMKLESIGPAVWVAKKRYVMALLSYKGVHHNPPKIKMQGIDAVRSSTPKFCREAIKTAIPLIIDGDERVVKDFIAARREAFDKLRFHEIAAPRGTNDLEKYSDKETIYSKGTPIHVRGALLYNHLVRERKLTETLPLIKSGDKIRFCFMRLPNPLRENIFACPDELPSDFELEPFIDYEKQFDKTLVDPLRHIIEAAGMKLTDDIDISQFFVSET